MELADATNGFFDMAKPWLLAKSTDPADREHLHRVLTQTLECFRVLTIYLKPFLPKLAGDVETFLGLLPQQWRDLDVPLVPGARIQPYRHLMARVDEKQLDALFEPAQAAQAANAAAASAATKTNGAANGRDDKGRIDGICRDRRAGYCSRRRRRHRGNRARDHHRRLRQGRPAHRPHRPRRDGRRLDQAAAADARHRRTRCGRRLDDAQRVFRHPERVRTRAAGRQADGDGRETSRRAR